MKHNFKEGDAVKVRENAGTGMAGKRGVIKRICIMHGWQTIRVCIDERIYAFAPEELVR